MNGPDLSDRAHGFAAQMSSYSQSRIFPLLPLRQVLERLQIARHEELFGCHIGIRCPTPG